ncbi:MAG: type II secretion system minor pseudopilin GspI [Gammaproteobacteria bacterium]|nr:type II secretion system minor pseudopilin GspI [Gammaproteobacteria bacterium]
MRHRKKQLGFLLVEILVALAILAIPLAAITRAVSQAIDTTAALRDRSIALWVAQDRLTMHRIERDWPPLKTTSGTSEMAGRSWRWQEKVISTPVAQLRRVEIEIHDENGPDLLAKLVGFLRDPQAKP